MGKKYLTLSQLNIEGQFLGFSSRGSDGGKCKIKYKHLYLKTSTQDVKIKIPKYLRCSLRNLLTGEQICVSVVKKLNRIKGKIKLTAYGVRSVGFCPRDYSSKENNAKIMVCQKSGCLKHGGKSLLANLEKTLCDRGLLDKVKIEHTNCQKTCSTAPNCILMLGKEQYSKLEPEAIASLLETHFFANNI
ncbi:(2Fe-2S) ferredoxin domain-containing protein [Cylindrospermopsis curvispora]|uniref:(2Fe-2S) ferredoxin domain-containing protein n=1 Tax=Cylindrospermopsis curvispora GIHE-G1 TaxID=2666332 RepID=A0A7H0F5C4_9CYAN|nr:(2Fe-2S) ferredoxin domain-containing protein [Cylindrospermopsis curvispora]QNP31240.1 (2Fe-2S) ferredoxin domain-containing protein [Cylindrospermopsis curvispora GIHE-G1]